MNFQSRRDFRTAERRLPFACITQGRGALGESPASERPEVQPIPAGLDRSARFSPVYNLFRHRLATDLVCAVPEDRPVPTFIEATNWTFGGRTDALPEGTFDPEAARTAARFIGFYLFVTLDRPSARSLASMAGCGPREPSPPHPHERSPGEPGAERDVG